MAGMGNERRASPVVTWLRLFLLIFVISIYSPLEDRFLSPHISSVLIIFCFY